MLLKASFNNVKENFAIHDRSEKINEQDDVKQLLDEESNKVVANLEGRIIFNNMPKYR